MFFGCLAVTVSNVCSPVVECEVVFVCIYNAEPDNILQSD